jgi:hypothetical protein
MRIVIPRDVGEVEQDDFPIEGRQHAEYGSARLLLRLKHFHPEYDDPGFWDVKIKQRGRG